MRSATVLKIRALECPNCGGSVELRSHGNAINAVCSQCLSILDSRTPALEILQKFEDRQRYTPLIPLGARGKLQGALREVIGFQVRQITVDGVEYRWSEYLLYNPFKGYLYLSEYDGHWSVIRAVSSVPAVSSAVRPTARYGGRTYKHFQTATATTVFVMGEFPWQVRAGDEVRVEDYVVPPFSLSSERTADEVTWSAGTYTPSAELSKAFSLPGKLPEPKGIYSSQPSPDAGQIVGAWKIAAALMLALVSLWIVMAMFTRREELFNQQYTFDKSVKSEPAFVTPVFVVPQHANIDVKIRANLDNDWAFFGVALISDDNGNAYDFGKEISYFHGRDSDGNWSEGSSQGSKMIPSVSPGRYYLRIEPDMDDETSRPHSVNYVVTVTTGAMQAVWFILALVLIPIPAIWQSWRSIQFENRRWAESDYS